MRKKLKIILLVFTAALTVFVMWQFGVFSGTDQPKVCLDAGHGGSDVGAEYNGRYEKDDNLKLTLAVGEILKDNGIKVIHTRKDDKFVELEERAAYANKKKATFFVSIHRNSAEAQVSGVEIWIENTAPVYEEKMAKNILGKIDEVGYGNSRGVKRGYQGDTSLNYLVNSATDMPSCLVEMGFITTEKDNELFDENFDEYARAIAEGIMESLK
ncbi:MAG: N-acetylmuramoyl-L-alanine amidase [Clostridia bacterium]|nr:N-acetylmuramoyl-L-alanine amidase [Clostridia bacterium]